ncbi:MAG: hypothetical protein H6707_14905 [Deltaproteobacteria bacterium]|nr:hypothetical protein [Deltaproteobacteria bacterium]
MSAARRRSRVVGAVAWLLLAAFGVGRAWGWEVELPDKRRSLRIALTQSLSVEYHADFDPLIGNPADTFTDFKNRTDVVVMHGTTSFNVRLDGNWVAGTDAGAPQRSNTALEKISLSTVQREFDLAAGDYYIRIGRGIALDLTKIDQLTRDMTLRGARASVRLGSLQILGFGGWVNPLDTDDTTLEGRDIPADIIAGAEIKLRLDRLLAVSVHYVGAMLNVKGQDASNGHHVVGGAINLPEIARRLGIYGEFNALIRTEDGAPFGTGSYAAVSANLGPVALLAEFKAYHRFVMRNTHGGDKDVYIYNRPPTLSRANQEIISSENIVGPRLQIDVRIGPVTPYLSYGYFFRSEAAADQGFFEIGMPVHDFSGGVSLHTRPVNVVVTAGYRIDQRDDQATGATIRDYSKLFGELTVELPLPRRQTVDLSAELRKLEKSGQKWWDMAVMLNYRPLHWLAVGGSLEWSTEAAEISDQYNGRELFGGLFAKANFTNTSYVQAFFGSRRGGLKCLDGLCRTLPPVVGVKGDLVLRF